MQILRERGIQTDKSLHSYKLFANPHNKRQNISGDHGFESEESRINMHFVASLVFIKSPINPFLIQSQSGTPAVFNMSIAFIQSIHF